MPIDIFFNFNRYRENSPQTNKGAKKQGKTGKHYFPLVRETGMGRNSLYSKAAADFFYNACGVKGK